MSNTSNTNGSGNGHDSGEQDNVVRLPTLAERDKLLKEKQKAERRAQAKAAGPMFNIGKIPPFTKYLALSFVLIHIVLFAVLDDAARLQAFYLMGFVPGYFTGALGGFQWFALLGPVTHMFIHAGWMHLLMNGTMTLALGMFFENRFGTRAAIIMFFTCGLAGAAAYFIFNPFATIPVIGASGGLSGLFGAMLVTTTHDSRIHRLGGRGALPMIGFWVVFMILAGVLSSENMAWQAHIGGFLTGAGLSYLMLRGKLRL